MKYEDYYKTLEVSRTASAEEIQRAYRKLARQYHPDVNKEKAAEERFKHISEAYEVLKDPEKRRQYDELGANWKAGQEFRPPPGWAGAPGGGSRGRRAAQGDMNDFGGFSDFFESLFGGGFGSSRSSPFGNAPRGQPGRRRPAEPGEDVSTEITITLAEVFHGGTRRLDLRPSDGGPSKSIEVRIPAGTTDGSTIRLAGQGSPSDSGGSSGDLLLRVRVAPDPRFEIDGINLKTVVPISPAEAVLGARVSVPLFSSLATLTIPPGSQSGQRMRLRGKGLPKRGSSEEHGDMIAELRIVVPKDPGPEERALYEQLAKVSNFQPRPA